MEREQLYENFPSHVCLAWGYLFLKYSCIPWSKCQAGSQECAGQWEEGQISCKHAPGSHPPMGFPSALLWNASQTNCPVKENPGLGAGEDVVARLKMGSHHGRQTGNMFLGS